jgi:hypothetical protein
LATNYRIPGATDITGTFDYDFNDICYIYRSSAQSFTDSTEANITFPSEYTDPNAMHSTVSNTHIINIPSDGTGLWLVGGEVLWATNSTGQRFVTIYRNAAIQLCVDRRLAATTAAACVWALTELDGSDTIIMNAYQNSGGALNLTLARLWVVRILGAS